jgi:hypothetical protein
MLQRLSQFCVALLDFLKQSDVLDGDDRLVGEGLKKRYLFVRERTDLLSPYVNYSNWSSLSEHRHTKKSARATTLSIELTVGKLVFSSATRS